MVVPPKSWQFVYLRSVDSTNAYAKDRTANSKPRRFTAVFTDHQTDGRGQYDRKWQANARENLLCSLIIPLEQVTLAPEKLFIWNMYITAVIRQALDSQVRDQVQIKWPNDLIINGKKVGGILIQNTYSGSTISSSIIGIGINVNQTAFDESLPYATSLKVIDNIHRNPVRILYEIAATIEEASIISDALKNPDFILNLYNKHLYKLGDQVTCIDPDGNPIIGELSGVDAQGKLLLAVDHADLALNHGQYRLQL